MIKWVLAVVASLVVVSAVFAGIVLFLFNREGPDLSDLTELQTAEVLEAKDLGSSYKVVYEYTYEGQKFYGRTTIFSKDLSSGSLIGICVDPSDPVQHAETYTNCEPGGPGTLIEGTKEKPEL